MTTTARRIPFLHRIIEEDLLWVSTLQDGPADDPTPGHFDPRTGERVYRLIADDLPAVP